MTVNTNNPLHKPLFKQRMRQISAQQWILFSQAWVVIPYINHLPTWLIVYALFVIGIQLQPIPRYLPAFIYQRRSLQILQTIGFLLSVVGLYLTYHTAFGLEVGLGFLLLCAVSKLLELYTRRDAYVALTLSMFVLAGLFLLEQTLTVTLEVMIGVLAVLTAMIALNDDGSGRLRTLLLLVLQAVPLTLLLFIFFPRLPPLWSVQLSGQQQGTTGISDHMAPGDVAKLSQSSELAFRALFPQPMPPREALYWRGLVLSNFDGVNWTMSTQTIAPWQVSQPHPEWLNLALPPIQSNHAQASRPYRYQVILEKTGQSWLFGLDYPLPQQIAQPSQIRLLADFTMRTAEPINQRFGYQVDWLPPATLHPILAETERRTNLQLPATGNPRTHALAQQLFLQAHGDPLAYSQLIAQWIRQQSFRYTLSPPPLGRDRVDDFLFSTRAGFCEHYASSFTVLMRAVGVPARVVVGYQGGELGRDGRSWEVRQMDAHAWSEIWVTGRGWVRIDPTAFIAPNRVEQGMDSITTQAGASMFGDGVSGQLSYQQFQLLQQARRVFDQAGYYWQREVVGYDQNQQQSSLFKWFHIRSVYQQIWLMTGLLLLTGLVLLLLRWRSRQPDINQTDAIVLALSKRLAKSDRALARADSEGVLNWLQRIQPSMQDSDTVTNFAQAYRQARYGQPSETANQQALKRLAKFIQPQKRRS